MSLRRLLLASALGAVLAAVGLAVVPSTVGAQEQGGADEPTLVVSPDIASPGDQVRIYGAGWPASRLVMVEICGQGARAGSADCTQTTARTISSNRSGDLSGRMEVALPPVPCPCVVHAFIATTSVSQTAVLSIEGAAFEPLPDEEVVAAPDPRLSVSARLDGDDGLATWFGAAPERTLHLDIENISTEEIAEPRLTATWGRGLGADGFIDLPPIELIRPGQTISLEVPVRMAPLAVGDYVVTGELVGETGTAFTVATSTFPWGLAAVPVLILLQWLLLQGRNLLRRRAERQAFEAEVEGLLHGAEVSAVPGPARDEERLDQVSGDLDHFDDDDEADDDLELVAVAPAARRSRSRTVGGLALALVAGLSLWIVRGLPVFDDAPPLEADAMCAILEEIDVVQALAGMEARPKAAAIARLAGLAGRAPDEVRVPLTILKAKVAERPGLERVASAAPDDGDAWNAAYSAVYGLELDSEFVAAASRVEKYAVDECGMEPSGVYNLDVVYQFDPADVNLALPEPGAPAIDLSSTHAAQRAALLEAHSRVPAPVIDVTDIQAQTWARVVEAPEVEFDRSEWEDKYGR